MPKTKENSILLTTSGGCESRLPIDDDYNYSRSSKLKNIFKKIGYHVCRTDRHIDIRNQINLIGLFEYYLVVNSITVWITKGLGENNVYMITKDEPFIETQYGVRNLLRGTNCKSIQDIEPEYIVSKLLGKERKVFL